jgi:DNA-binding NtrC family response regulator
MRAAVTRGPDRGTSIEFVARSIRVGLAIDNDLVLRDDTVSRRHCEIEALPEGLRVRDLGSTNGVMVASGVRLFDALLPAAEPIVLLLGDTEITVTALGAIEREQAADDRFGDVLGAAPCMRELFADLQRIALSDVTLLIEGDTGTGKDLVAEAVHGASQRAQGPFVVFDCGAVTPVVVHKELFGDNGVFEQARGGTVFLDEVGELPLDVQPMLLRVLDKLPVRVIAATSRKLAQEVAAGRFREALYFRLAAAHVAIPPLRDRMQDIPMLVENFLAAERPARSLVDLPADALEMFAAYRWPGNVRELRNAVQRLLVTPGRAIHVLAPAAAELEREGELLPLRIARREAADAFERSYLRAVLARSSGNVSRAAAVAEVSRQMIQKMMRKHDVPGGGKRSD